MQKRAKKSLFLMICTQTSCVMIYHYSVMDKKMTEILYQNYSHFLERVMGIEPTTTAWEAVVLPLNYTRNYQLNYIPIKGKLSSLSIRYLVENKRNFNI